MSNTDTQYTELNSYMARCALIALGMEQKEGLCGWKLSSEHKFLTQWLIKAYKQKRFPRNLSENFELMIRLAREKGQFSNLKQRLTELSQEKPESESEQEVKVEEKATA